MQKSFERWIKLRRSPSVGWGDIALMVAYKVRSGWETLVSGVKWTYLPSGSIPKPVDV